MLALIIGAASMPVTLEEFKRYGEYPDDRDPELTRALRAAVEYAEAQTGLVAQPKTLQLRLDAWYPPCPCPADACEIEIPAAPVRAVRSVTYVDADGVEQTVAPESYSWERTPEGALLSFGSDFSPPEVKAGRHGVVRVTLDAGFDNPEQSGSGDDPELKLPERLVTAVLMLAAHYWEHREAVSDQQTYPVLSSADAILAQLRIYR